MATKKSNANLSDTQKIGIGVGLTAAAVAAAGTYFLYGSKGASKNRKAVKSWALKAKAEVLEKLESAKQMSKEEYEQVIDSVIGVYGDLKQASKVDVSGFKKEMKDEDAAPPPTASATPEAPKQVENVTTVNAEPVQETTKQA